jgi:hypothetical protein
VTHKPFIRTFRGDSPDYTPYLNTPADLPVEWRQTRLAWKFWKLLNRRALGIKDSVLEVAE